MRAARKALVALRVAAILPVLVACGARTDAYTRKLAAADRIYAQGRYDEAALSYAEAAKLAGPGRDRDEALYREGESFRRGGRATQAAAVLGELARGSPRGERTARAEYELALMALDAGDEAGGEARLDAILRAHPESGIAPAALEERLRGLAPRGQAAVRAYLDGLIPTLTRSELGQYLHYDYAASLEREGRLEDARARYVFVAARYPFPAGALWDDALWHAADLDARLGDPRAAIRRLEAILAERDTAYFVGSYERSRYPEAQARIAELYRDALHDPGRARAAFEKLWSDFPTSRMRDDGAWQAAKLAVQAGDRAGACRLLESLARTLPDSRYVGCIPHFCPAFRPTGAVCHDYIVAGE